MSEDPLNSLTPKQAWEMLNEDARAILIDIRSSMEYLFVGHPKGAVHVAWIDEPDWVVNPHFVTEVRQLILGGVVEDDAQGSAPIILICRSGKRSKEAGHKLLEAGITVRYFPYARGGERGPGYRHLRSVRCAQNRNQAMTDAKNQKFDSLPSGDCEAASTVDRGYLAGNKIGISGTPALIKSNGEKIEGYRPYQELIPQLLR